MSDVVKNKKSVNQTEDFECVNEWQISKFGDYVDAINGYAFKSSNFLAERLKGAMPVIKIKNVANGKSNLDGVQYHLYDKTLAKYVVKKGDVLIALTGNHPQAETQVVGLVTKYHHQIEGLLNQRVAKIVAKDENSLCNDFIYYFLKDKNTHQYLSSQSTGSANQANISKTDIENISFAKPTNKEQKAIATILSSLDDKIDLLHRQNKTLEAMAETLFRQWFVEDEGEEIVITDLVEFNPQRKLSKGEIAPYLEMAELSTATFNPSGWYEREFSSGTKFINGDTLLARITPCLENGKTAYVTFLKENQVGWGSTEFIVIRPKPDLHPLFGYTLARNQVFREYAEGCMAGSSGRQRVDVNHLKLFEIGIPSKQAIKQFNILAESIAPKLHANMIQIKSLEKLRDGLLPKLMSGELPISQ